MVTGRQAASVKDSRPWERIMSEVNLPITNHFPGLALRGSGLVDICVIGRRRLARNPNLEGSFVLTTDPLEGRNALSGERSNEKQPPVHILE